MKKIALVCFLLGFASTAQAAVITFTSESAYLSAIGAYSSFVEGFESVDWEPSRPAGTSSITSQGLTWTGSDLIRTGDGWARSGRYGVFDSIGDPDIIYVLNSADRLFAAGGWFRNTTASELTFSLGSTPVWTVPLSADHFFFGVLDTEGFTALTLSTSSGHWGADDFTFARGGVVPEPGSMILLGTGLVGLGRAWKKRRG